MLVNLYIFLCICNFQYSATYTLSFLNFLHVHALSLSLSLMQSDEHCCNSCEEVREAYKKKGWALTNMDLIDQVYLLLILFHNDYGYFMWIQMPHL